MANIRWGAIQVATGLAPSYADYLRRRAADPDGADARSDSALLRAMIDACRRQHVSIGIVLFPDAGPDLGADYPFAFLHEHVLAVCRAEGLPCLDLRADFAAVTDRRSLWVSPFDHHPSARANAIAATRILETFHPQWVQR